MIVLGTYSKNDQDLIDKIASEFGDQYNIFYKSHSGMYENAEFINKKILLQ
ncbi:Uncharacterised protein [Mycoplasmopsis edwardii]|uniref:Uncharacterized protein n=1 Tax=Mycoplasmopsis edwardii TaxID=53558 RepID=A0A3B0QA91_9BACT|nr:Uncharacterised protein [Mycoplasmopsis edwardii]